MELDLLRCSLRGIAAYKHLMDEPVMELVMSMLDALNDGRGEEAVERYTRLFYTMRTEGKTGLSEWLYDVLRYRESPYARMVERGGDDPVLTRAARRDIEVLAQLADLDCGAVIGRIAGCVSAGFMPVLDNLPRWACSAKFDFDGLTAFYQANGSGIFAQYRAFLWEGGKLWPVLDPDSHTPEEMMGYERQRSQVIANTRAMLEGNLVNNVLLYGESGTGKSATVKSLLSLPGFDDLRLIEVEKDALGELPDLIRTLAGRRRKFILFVDDLAFDQDDRTYSALKTILEGGLERRPANVAIYATSNRRHLVREVWSDRGDVEHNGDIHRSDTVEEKLSLASRFGLQIFYPAPTFEEYQQIVSALSEKAGTDLSPEQLRAAAATWQVRSGSRSGRTARQFVDQLEH